MKSRTEILVEKVQQARQDKFKAARRALDCLEQWREGRNCQECPDRPLCRRLQDAL